MKSLEIFAQFILILAIIIFVLRELRNPLLQVIEEIGDFVCDLKTAIRRALHRIRNS